MNAFKKIALLMALTLSVGVTAHSENAFGVRAGFNTRNNAPLAGLWFQHSFGSHLRVSPNVDYHFRHNNTDALALNCNVQFPYRLLPTSRFSAYPFVGLNYTSWNYRHDDGDDVTSRLNRFGINTGAGIEYQATSTMKVAFEAKATFIKSYSSGCFTLSLGYCF